MLRKCTENHIACLSFVDPWRRQVPVEFLCKFDPASEQWTLLKGFVHTVMSTGVEILEGNGGFDMNDPPGLGISSNPSLCVSLLELTLRCCVFAPALLIDLPCFPSALMMVASSLNYIHRNCCSISMQIVSKMFQCPALAAVIRPHTQILLNIVCSSLPKLAPLEVLRLAGSAIHGILHSPHGAAVDALLTAALMQPSYSQVSVALKQRFVATVHINIGNAQKFCSFVKDFAMVRIVFPRASLHIMFVHHVAATLHIMFVRHVASHALVQVCRSLESEDSLIAYETATPPRAASGVHPSRRQLLGI
jgi:hypothetical protein